MVDQASRPKTKRLQMSHYDFDDEWIPYRTTTDGNGQEPEVATDVVEGGSAEIAAWLRMERMERELK
jgi:hypothetical protein